MSNKANSANEKSFLLLEQMLKSLFNVANKVSTVSQNENELAKKVENMVNQAGNIQKATQMMDEIADKTNLLSLNAGIEAARAGAFGRGFSVIAEDVRQLAQNSEEFLGNVAQITKELLQSINEVSAELKKNAQSVQALNDDTALLVDDANEVKLCNEDARALVTQCTEKIKISQENIQNLLSRM
ncbi:histidine kinase [Campylobacter jejuni]|nr:histidine kinase [Campylobacter jejuni]EAM0681395.1 histidine kinase [Campylobacter jejuni]EEU6927215.1 histidine kinase [Campylobacter jejuni]EFO6253557.1 histidine kinase [Campylobacter jejuni]HDZ4107226.1 histidine kinase [Campylobacter jejuni]